MDDQATEIRLFVLAAAGSVEELMAVLAEDAPTGCDGEADEWAGAAYKWLNVASDHGHDEADDMIDDLLESVLRHDDDHLVTGHVHFELAAGYLTGNNGLPVDFDKAHHHLMEMLDRGYPVSVQSARTLLDEARETMDSQARHAFDAVLCPSN